MNLDGRPALVTGSSSGIGEQIAVRLAEAGMDVCVHYAHNEDKATSTAKQVRELGGDAPVLQADLTDPTEAEALVERAVDELGQVDVLVNNAGVLDSEGSGPRGAKPFEERIDEWDRVMNVNLRAPFVLASRLAEQMADRGEGGIVNVASISGWYAQREVPLYSLSKAGLLHLTRQLALQFAPEVRVNAVAPGWAPTSFGWGHLETEAFQELVTESIPLDRMAEVDEVAEAVHFLLADADYTTGATLTVDGGLGAKLR